MRKNIKIEKRTPRSRRHTTWLSKKYHGESQRCFRRRSRAFLFSTTMKDDMACDLRSSLIVNNFVDLDINIVNFWLIKNGKYALLANPPTREPISDGQGRGVPSGSRLIVSTEIALSEVNMRRRAPHPKTPSVM